MMRRLRLTLLFMLALALAVAMALAIAFALVFAYSLQAAVGGAAGGGAAGGMVGGGAAGGAIGGMAGGAAGGMAGGGAAGGMAGGVAAGDVGTLLGQVVGLADSFLPLYAALVFLSICMVAALLTFTLSKLYFTPMGELARDARRVAGGDLDRPVQRGLAAAGAGAGGGDVDINAIGEAIERMRAALKEAVSDRLRFEEARKLMVATISHDLRTPVTAIKGYAEGIRDGVAVTEEMRARYVSTIIMKARDIESLVGELLDFAYGGAGQQPRQFKTVDLDAWLREEARTLAGDYAGIGVGGRPVSISFARVDAAEPAAGSEPAAAAGPVAAAGPAAEPMVASSSGSVNVSLDEGWFRRALHNLVKNSIKFQQEDSVEPISVSLLLSARGGEALVETRDNGIGIAEHDLRRVFEMFYMADKSRNKGGGDKSYGLGLAIAKEIVTAHGGRIWARPAPGGGGGGGGSGGGSSGGTSVFISLKTVEDS